MAPGTARWAKPPPACHRARAPVMALGEELRHLRDDPEGRLAELAARSTLGPVIQSQATGRPTSTTTSSASCAVTMRSSSSAFYRAPIDKRPGTPQLLPTGADEGLLGPIRNEF